MLFQLDPAELLPSDHAVWRVLEIVGEFDLTEFEAAYRLDGVGRPPVAPAIMVALLLYCGNTGLCSSYEVVAACVDDLGCHVILGGRRVGPSTITDFKDRHGQALRNLFVQTLRIGHGEGLVDVSVVAGDGTYLLASAAKTAVVDARGLQQRIADARGRVEQAQQRWQAAVCRQPSLPVAPGTGGERSLPQAGGRERVQRRVDPEPAARRALQAASRRLDRLLTAAEHLQEHPCASWQEWAHRRDWAQDRLVTAQARLAEARAAQQARIDARTAAQAAGRRFPGLTPVPVDQHCRVLRATAQQDAAARKVEQIAAAEPAYGKVNTTDPTSTFMPGKRGGTDPRYNVQVVSCPNQFILTITTHPCSNDKQALKRPLGMVRKNLDAAGITDPIGTAMYDSGYASEDNFTADLPVEKLLVAVEKERRQTGRDTDPVIDARTGKTTNSTAASCWEEMGDLLRLPENAALYKRRAGIVEPAFAQLFTRFGRELTYRTTGNVETELHRWALIHNTAKIIKVRRARPRTSSTPPS